MRRPSQPADRRLGLPRARLALRQFRLPGWYEYDLAFMTVLKSIVEEK